MNTQKRKLYTVSNAHLDTQWNWTIQETIRDYIKDTLLKNFELFKKYPHYRMNFEGAFRYQLAKEYYPDLYAQLKEYVAEGRWNVAGSQWDASDANIPSSEGYMRQILLGNGFFEAEFGKKSTDIFLPDCFGFRHSLPSIAAHMGLKGFSTQKLMWGAGAPIIQEDGTITAPMPNQPQPRLGLGKWVGPDGNYVVAYFNGGGYTRKLEKGDIPSLHDRDEYARDIAHNEKFSGAPVSLIYYGVGDCGGAPTDGSARTVNEAVEQNGEDKAFEVIAASTDQLFNELTPEQIDALPSYNGHLHIPHGFGSMTSRAINKRWNRKCELLANSAERAASVAKWLGKADYPKDRFHFAWKLFLWHQFHDDLPGTSILEAYRFSYNDYLIAQNVLADELTAAADAVTSTLNTNVSGEPVVVYNPVSFERSDLVVAPIPAGAKHARVYTADGTEVPSQISTSETDGAKVVKFVATVAPVSFTVFNVVSADSDCDMDTGLSVSLGRLENDRYRVTLNFDGNIASIFDKENNRELLSAPSSLGTREDNNDHWPAWEIKYEDTKLPFTDVGGAASIEVVEAGPAVVALKVTKRDKGSEYIQTISLTAGGQRVNVDNDVNWHNLCTLLSAGFPLSVSNPTAYFDLGLGAQPGENTDSYPYFQHCVHQWADLTDTDGSFGVAILNDCKYGMEKPNDNTLRLTLIHTPKGAFKTTTVQDWQDHGRNIFKYGFTSHAGSRDGVAAEAECLNTPLMAFQVTKHGGESTGISFVSTNKSEVTVRCAKQEEKGNRLIVRVQNTSASAQNGVKLTLAAHILGAVETNGYEEGSKAVDFDANSLTFDMTPYAVKTFALELANAEAESHNGTPVALDYHIRVTTPGGALTAGEFGKGISIPEELFEKQVHCGGLDFVMGNPGENNAVICRGQSIKLPAGTKKVAILAASTDGDVEATFQGTTVKVRDFSANIGTWDQIACGDQAYINREPVAVSYSHTHDKDGDRLYKFANLFRYTIDVNGAEEITLPVNEQVVIMAMTAVTDDSRNTVPTAPLYDYVQDRTDPPHTLTAVDMDVSGQYHEGDMIRVCALRCNHNGLFTGFGGTADIVYQNDLQALVRMGNTDAVIYPLYSDNGENVVLNKPCKAHAYCSESEHYTNAFNGHSRNMWAGTLGDDGLGWLEADIGEVTPINKWLTLHCGDDEGSADNTVDFRLEYKVNEDDEWQIADAVEGNTADYNLREFAPVNARYVRICITKPSPNTDRTCRIVQFHVYKYNG